MLRVLALEPFYNGSHKAFLDGWIARSRHRWQVLGLPAHKWKWRMRHAAVTLAEQVSQRIEQGSRWDVLFCSDMLNLAEFRGLVHRSLCELPTVVYFHENQLTYPVREAHERDYHFAFTNFTTALSADQVWFNSAFHRESFLTALRALLRRMPDYQSLHCVDQIETKAAVHPPGVEMPSPPGPRVPGPLRIVWAARWEHDKDPETFFKALEIAQSRGASFRLSVLGEQFAQTPDVFRRAHTLFQDQIDHWGYEPTRQGYLHVLRQADVFVSTAQHEFFGLSAVEAMAAGAYPLLPKRLSYPELLRIKSDSAMERKHFYDGSPETLATRIVELCAQLDRGELWGANRDECRNVVSRFAWEPLAAHMDDALESLAR